ncbi:Glucose-6-phosphate/phosphate translocator 2, chloroplastic, partial [Glycine soja]
KASNCKASARDIPTINNVEQNTGPSELCSEKPLYLSSTVNLALKGEPTFSVLVSRFLLGKAFPIPVYLSLLPIIGGGALAAVTKLNFNMIEKTLDDVSGFTGAMISNLEFVYCNIFSKKGMKGMSISGMNNYSCFSIMLLSILTPFAIVVEDPKVWAAGWQTNVSQIGPNFVWWVAAQSVFYHLYNQVPYTSLDQISPLTFSIGNTMKRILPINVLGIAIAILGTFLYSQDRTTCVWRLPDLVCNLVWSKNVNELVSTHGYSQNYIIVWRYPFMSKLATLTGHTYKVLYVAISPEGHTIVTGVGDETLRFWNVMAPSLTLERHKFMANLRKMFHEVVVVTSDGTNDGPA